MDLLKAIHLEAKRLCLGLEDLILLDVLLHRRDVDIQVRITDVFRDERCWKSERRKQPS